MTPLDFAKLYEVFYHARSLAIYVTNLVEDSVFSTDIIFDRITKGNVSPKTSKLK